MLLACFGESDGLDGPGKLLIGSKICAELLGKLMCDLESMKVRRHPA